MYPSVIHQYAETQANNYFSSLVQASTSLQLMEVMSGKGETLLELVQQIRLTGLAPEGNRQPKSSP